MSGSSRAFLLRPKWIAFHLLVFAAIGAMIWLAFWQLRRLDERRAFNDVVAERIDQPPVAFAELLPTAIDDPDAVEWRQVTVSGSYLDDQIIWFNRSQDGLAGDNVLSALVDDDTTVVVNRGFIVLGSEVPPVPDGEVEVLGRIRVPGERQRGGLTDSADGPVTEVRRVDLGLLEQQLPGQVAPVYLDLIGSVPNVGPADPAPVPAPTLDEGPHLSYAVQWLIFATAVLIGWVLAIRRSLATRRRALSRERNDEQTAEDTGVTDAAGERTTPGSPTPSDAASATTPS
jgi:cytochrome oxidase assembly protein ShyY1